MRELGSSQHSVCRDTRRRNDVVLRGMRLWGEYSVGFVKDCNWLQHYENIVDPWHLLMLHQMISGDQFEGALMQGAPEIGFENTPLGVRYRVVKDLPNGNRFVRHAECIVPNAFLIPDIRETGTTPKRNERCTELSGAVPVDNEHVTGLSIVAWPLEQGEPKKGWRPWTDTVQEIRPGSLPARTYEERQGKKDDLGAQEGQRSISVHALETSRHLIRGLRCVRERPALQVSIPFSSGPILNKKSSTVRCFPRRLNPFSFRANTERYNRSLVLLIHRVSIPLPSGPILNLKVII
jgi:hypothetical protein